MEKKQKKLLWLFIPIFFETLFFMLMGIVDTIMLGNYSDAAAGGVGLANGVMSMFTVMLNVCAAGVAVVASQYIGANKPKEAKDAAKVGAQFNVLVGVLIFALIQIFGRAVLVMMKTKEIHLDIAVDYVSIVSFGVIFLSISTANSAILRSHGKPFYVTITALIANIINVGLNYVLINGYDFGIFEVPELGATGAAYGTLISRSITAIITLILVHVLIKINLFKVSLKFFINTKHYLGKIVKVGLPSAVENLLYHISQIFVFTIINTMADNAVTARIYVFQILMLVFVFSFALASANQILVGYRCGERDFVGAYRKTNKTLIYSYLVVTLILTVYNVFSQSLFELFTSNQEIIDIAQKTLLICYLIEIGRATNFMIILALKGTGDAIFPAVVASLSMFLIGVTLSYVLGITLAFGIVGVFLALGIEESVRGAIVFARWRSGKWKTKVLV